MREKFKALKERFNSQQGFTLIELMATIAILALIVVIAVPAIGSIMTNAQNDSYANSQSMVERAAQIAHLDDSTPAVDTNGDGHFQVSELISAGFLDLEAGQEYGDNSIDADDYAEEVQGGKYEFKKGPAPGAEG